MQNYNIHQFLCSALEESRLRNPHNMKNLYANKIFQSKHTTPRHHSSMFWNHNPKPANHTQIDPQFTNPI